MIGDITDDHTRQDIVDAKALGLDAFALNINSLQPWATGTVDHLFNNADELDFSLFFSFDMAPGYFTSPDQFSSYLQPYLSRPSYFKHKSQPLVSTFGGESVPNSQWTTFKSTLDANILLIPGFYQATPSTDFFSPLPALDGVFNWNSWAPASAGQISVPTTDDTAFLAAARNASKLFMLGISPLQFKHIDSSQNWYRRGESNLEVRLAQALALQPDMLEIQTWNDAGESHYVGNIWDEPMTGSPIHGYVDGYDHRGYQQILASFVQAWKRGDEDTTNMVPTNGKVVQGTFWHHTLTVGADCGADALGKPGNVDIAEDVVSGIVLVAKGNKKLVAVVSNGDKELGKLALEEGYNKFKFEGLGAGKVQLEVWDGSTMVGGGYAPMEVVTEAELCNYNFQVVGFPG
ncbi:hypothetical protein EJ04DRAFT_489009 [Polyplosphaeria fusca]|uniref:Glycoside hydrolase family 71 protein n=1 Tax=Polyplosphaeria fusca TaxID=682080 RepID=A0A9P4R4V4_9PLEO|nr:hypothetical protein EJ04DRAFT_489009 [Polyplosphaeria fusca]